ncbi:MAG: amidohydrolase family protein [Chloroflexi bacterium]|nr:amidohydrolase family protein [Chloroflexota bacterium]
MSLASRNTLVATARGDVPPQLLIKNATLVDVLTASTYQADIGVTGNRIAFVVPAGQAGAGERIIDGKGLFAVPGFIDGHVHNESSMVTPANWAKTLLRYGTTTVFTDPHEITNVMGLPGIRYMIEASRGLPLRYYITAPSCVPAVPSVETAGAVITATEMRQILTWERVHAIAEAMDFMGLIHQGGNITPIVEVAHSMEIGVEGHAPGVVDWDLQAYAASTGPLCSDHEASTVKEILQRVHAGIMVYAKSSTFIEDSAAVAEAMHQVRDTRMFGFCTDDIMPHRLAGYGHLNFGLRRLISHGVSFVTAVQMATFNVAQHYRLYGLGAIAPGWLADIVLIDNPEEVTVQHVIADGQWVVANRKLMVDIPEPVAPLMMNSVKIPSGLTTEDFTRLGEGTGSRTSNGMDLTNLFTKQASIPVTLTDGKVNLPLPAGIAIAAIVTRHGQGTKPSLSLVTGYPLKEGAVASTVSHDSHNLAVIGRDPKDMLAAVKELERTGGGLTVVRHGQVLATVPLPVAGLMSNLPVEEVAAQLNHFEATLPEVGLPVGFPIHLLALALPVVPDIRLTDKGLVDVATQQFVPLMAD